MGTDADRIWSNFCRFTSEMARSRTDIMTPDPNEGPMPPTLICVVILRCSLVEITTNKQSILRLMKNVHLVTFLVTFKI
jgi:hypothetical protein